MLLHSHMRVENGIINSEKVEKVMQETDRADFCTHSPYLDSPQSIGNIFVLMCARLLQVGPCDTKSHLCRVSGDH